LSQAEFQSRMNYELRPLVSRAISSPDQKQSLDGDTDQSRLLLEINNAVVNHLDLEELLKVIFDCIKEVFKQTTAATLSVYDPESNTLRVHRLHSPQPETFREGMPIELEDTPSGLAFNSRQIVLIRKVTYEDFPSELVKRALADGVRSGCSVPLISHNRVLGTITLGADQEGAYSEADAELLGQVAQQIAMPVENALNFQRAERARDRAQLVLEAGNLIVANLELRDLLIATSACLRKYFQQDFFALSLYDEVSGQLRLHTLDVFPDKPVLDDGIPLDMAGTPGGHAFSTRQTVVIDRLNPDDYSSPALVGSTVPWVTSTSTRNCDTSRNGSYFSIY
jgi:transcriptional regulator with GAF, ATPase, and Fis domain